MTIKSIITISLFLAIWIASLFYWDYLLTPKPKFKYFDEVLIKHYDGYWEIKPLYVVRYDYGFGTIESFLDKSDWLATDTEYKIR